MIMFSTILRRILKDRIIPRSMYLVYKEQSCQHFFLDVYSVVCFFSVKLNAFLVQFTNMTFSNALFLTLTNISPYILTLK